jgi:hypothetical protein
VAAEKSRVHQARTIIGRVRVVSNEQETPAFVHITITEDDGSRRDGYAGVEVALNDDGMRAQVFCEACSGRGWRTRLAAFEQACQAVKLIGEAIEALEPDGEGDLRQNR